MTLSWLRSEKKTPGLSQVQVLLFSFTAGLAVGNLYWTQPLLAVIATSFHVSLGLSGLLVTVTQIGYAVGIVLIVPVGDSVNRRRLIPIVMSLSALCLTACFLAPSFGLLLVSLGFLGVTTVSGQILVPLASELAPAEQRGRVVGTIVSGILTGILLSRTLSGFLADALGWRSIYAAAALVLFLFSLVMALTLKTEKKHNPLGYGELLASTLALVKKHRAVRVTLILGSSAFAIFSAFWTGLTFLLSAPPFSFSMTQIGLVGLVGVVGALAAQRAGWLHDRGYSVLATGVGLLVVLGSLGLSLGGAQNLWAVLAAVLFLDMAVQMVNVLNQNRLFSLAPQARSRLNSAFVFCNFVSGALGSVLSGILWDWGGWTAITGFAMAVVAFALLVWVLGRHQLNESEEKTGKVN